MNIGFRGDVGAPDIEKPSIENIQSAESMKLSEAADVLRSLYEKVVKIDDKMDTRKDIDYEIMSLCQNKEDGLRREREVSDELNKKYPSEEGYSVEAEVYLRDKDGKIVKDPETNQARRIDFVVLKDGKVVDSIEVTSKTADKTAQSEKESRIREAGGNYIKDRDGNLIEIPQDVQTRIERRD